VVLLAAMIVVVIAASFIGLIPYSMYLTKKSFNDPVTREVYHDLMFQRVNPVFFILVPLVVVQHLMLQIFNKFGPGVFWKIARGKYYKPKSENRIFMFVDLNSSTTIAEKLGNERYHELLKDFFADITNSILNHRGEIYQYLGDGVIIVWNAYADERDIRSIECFFDMKKEIQNKSDKYIRKFELLPGIKAGIHSGEVIVGEIGIIKRDITYSGDVVNTTARIESMCNELQSEVLISNELLQQLPRDSKFTATSVGAIHLKGKEKEVELISLHLN
jgi:adenylate cyclase